MGDMMRGNKGFSVIELLVVFTIIALAAPSLFLLMNAIDNRRKIDETHTKVKMLNEVIKRVFWENLNFARRNCYGWADPSCAGLTLTPELVDGNTIRINTIDPTVLQVLVNYGCLVTTISTTSYAVRCYDGHGKLFQFQIQNEHRRGQPYYLPYQNQQFSLSVIPSIGDPLIINLDNEITFALAKTDTILNDIAEAVRGRVRRTRQLELGNSCGTTNTTLNPIGGLASWDDTIVPWVWKAVSQNPTSLCSGIENAQECGCSNFSIRQNWETDSQYCRVDTTTEWLRLLGNLGLGTKYRTDGLGNALTFVPLADANGNPVQCPPPRPRPSYPVTNLIPKSRVGVYDAFLNTWYRYLDVVSE